MEHKNCLWIIVILSLCILQMGLVYGEIITNFSDGSTSGNLTFNTSLEMPTKTIVTRTNVNIIDARINLRGFLNTNGTKGKQYNHIFGNNVTTYRGLWTDTYNTNVVPGISEFGESNDNITTTFVAIFPEGLAAQEGWGSFKINFSFLNTELQNAQHNVSVIIYQLESGSYVNTFLNCTVGSNTYYVYSWNSTHIVQLLNIPLPERCIDKTNNNIQLVFNTNFSPKINYLSNFRVYEVAINGTNASYPVNITLRINNQTNFYSYNNNSGLAGFVTANISNAFNYSNITLWNVSFSSNLSSIVEYSSLYVRTSSNFTIRFLDERDGSIFKLNQTNETYLTLYCGDSAYEYPHITSGTYTITSPCDNFNQLRVSVSMNDQPTYYRTLLTKQSSDIPVYLVNLFENRSVVQIIYNLIDLNGRWGGSEVVISRYVNSTNASIIEQRFDVDNKVYLWLMKDSVYNITVVNQYGEKYHGGFIASDAETKNLYLPSNSTIDNYYEDNIYYYYYFNASEHTALFHFQDYGDLESKTTFVNFSLRWAKNGSTIYYAQIVGNPITYYNFLVQNPLVANATNYILANVSYIMEWWAVHPVLGVLHGSSTFGDYSYNLEKKGFTDTEFNDYFKYGGAILLIVVLLLFGARYSHIGGIVVFIFAIIFKEIGFFDWITTGALIIIGIIAVINYMRREEVSVG